MDAWALTDIAGLYMNLENPVSTEKILALGRYLGLGPGSRVLDVGCGYAEALMLWSQHFDSTGVGIDARPAACERARREASRRGLGDHVDIVCAPGQDYAIEVGRYDAATCIGATFIWGGFSPTVAALEPAIHERGRLALGTQVWQTGSVPVACARAEMDDTCHEHELLGHAHDHGFEIERLIRASTDDWDRYETDRWHGLLRWLEENPRHPERGRVVEHLHAMQGRYLRHGRKRVGWVVAVLAPRPYPRT